MSPSRSRKPRVVPRSGGTKARAAEDWREERLSDLRAVIVSADPAIVEEVKWRKPSNPDGVPVWSHNGMVCVGNVLKAAVRLTFPSGAQLKDPTRLFNTRLDSRTVRAIDFYEGVTVDTVGLTNIIRQAVTLNESKPKKR